MLLAQVYSLDKVRGLSPKVSMRNLRDAVPLMVLICAQGKVDDEADDDTGRAAGPQQLSVSHQ